MTTKAKDKYERAIEYLTEHPEEIYMSWGSAPVRGSKAEVRGVLNQRCLFAATGPDCGCLTQVRTTDVDFAMRAPTLELTEAIRADRRIPSGEEDITVDDLPVFAEWQRKIDAMYERGEL